MLFLADIWRQEIRGPVQATEWQVASLILFNKIWTESGVGRVGGVTRGARRGQAVALWKVWSWTLGVLKTMYITLICLCSSIITEINANEVLVSYLIKLKCALYAKCVFFVVILLLNGKNKMKEKRPSSMDASLLRNSQTGHPRTNFVGSKLLAALTHLFSSTALIPPISIC